GGITEWWPCRGQRFAPWRCLDARSSHVFAPQGCRNFTTLQYDTQPFKAAFFFLFFFILVYNFYGSVSEVDGGNAPSNHKQPGRCQTLCRNVRPERKDLFSYQRISTTPGFSTWSPGVAPFLRTPEEEPLAARLSR
ncbi:hypothetical protein ILYODFUR_011750, partial [Ilyodon furcidens]